MKERVEAQNELESYAYSLKNQIGDKEKLGGKLSDEEKSTIEGAVDEKIKWLEGNKDASAEEYQAQKKELESVVQPIVSKLYQGQEGAGGETPPPAEDEAKDEL